MAKSLATAARTLRCEPLLMGHVPESNRFGLVKPAVALSERHPTPQEK